MGLWETIKEKMSKKEERKLLKGLDEVKESYEEADTRKEAIKAAAQRAIEKMKDNPDMSAVEFLKLIQEEETLPEEIVGEVAKKMPEELSEEEVVEAVEELDLTAETIQEIIEEADVSISTEQSLVNQIPDKEIKQEHQEILREKKEKKNLQMLEILYEKCTQLNDPQFVAQIRALKISEHTPKIKEKIADIVAKKVADDFMKFGTAKIPTIAQIIPVEQMLEINLPRIVQKEYNLLKSDKKEEDTSYYPYEQKLLKIKILENVARNVAYKYQELGEIAIPQSEQMNNLTKEEEEIFIDSIQKYCSEERLGKRDIEKARRQIRGEITNDTEDLIKMFDKIPLKQREEYATRFKKELEERLNKSEEEKNAETAIYKLNQKLNKLPIEQRIKTADMMTEILEEREEAKKLTNLNNKNNKEEDYR